MVLRPLYCGFTMAPPCRGRSRRPLRHTPPAGRAATATSGVRTGSGVTLFRRLQLPTAQAPARCPDNRSRPPPSPPGSGCHGNAWRGPARPAAAYPGPRRPLGPCRFPSRPRRCLGARPAVPEKCKSSPLSLCCPGLRCSPRAARGLQAFKGVVIKRALAQESSLLCWFFFFLK